MGDGASGVFFPLTFYFISLTRFSRNSVAFIIQRPSFKEKSCNTYHRGF